MDYKGGMNENNVDIGIAATTLKPTPEEITVSVPENVTAIVMNEVGDPTVALTGSTNVAVDGEDTVTTTVAEGLTVSNSVINVEPPIAKPPPRVVNTAHLMTHIVNPDLSDDSVFSGDDDSCDGEPAEKRMKLEQDINIDMDQSLKQILFNINKAICLRLDSIENKLENVGLRTKYLEVKLLDLVNQNKTGSSNTNSYAMKRGSTSPSRRSGALIVGLPQDRNSEDESQFQKGIDSDILQTMQLENKDKKGKLLTPSDFNSNVDSNFRNIGPNVTLITLNSEEDYPNGCWLGDELNLEMRVRVPISSSDLLHIHSNCRTAEKMALTLLDYLFDRETQACSNLSGMGKHGKKQLDPLMIYGIWCHLIQRFKINESDWQRIKQNIDSKCRTAFRRKSRGLPLAVKAFRGRAPPSYVHNTGFNFNSVVNSQSNFYDSNLHEDTKFHIQQQSELDIQQAVTMQGEALQQGEIQILHATPEQISQLQHAQHIQILQGDQVIQQLQSADNQEGVQVVSMGTPDRVHVATVTTENGEIVHIHQARSLANVGASTATTAATPTITTATTDGSQTNV
ncbi:protein BANP isoform X1 [Octopus sinensis]|nr:protein BANP isoform X1 [Octopus sinensis]